MCPVGLCERLVREPIAKIVTVTGFKCTAQSAKRLKRSASLNDDECIPLPRTFKTNSELCINTAMKNNLVNKTGTIGGKRVESG